MLVQRGSGEVYMSVFFEEWQEMAEERDIDQ